MSSLSLLVRNARGGGGLDSFQGYALVSRAVKCLWRGDFRGRVALAVFSGIVSCPILREPARVGQLPYPFTVVELPPYWAPVTAHAPPQMSPPAAQKAGRSNNQRARPPTSHGVVPTYSAYWAPVTAHAPPQMSPPAAQKAGRSNNQRARPPTSHGVVPPSRT